MQKKYIISQANLQRDLFNFGEYNDNEVEYAKKDVDILLDVKKYIDNNNKINTQEIMKMIFPINVPHLFISHKSEFASDAIRLANVLYDKFNIVSFIDSQVWHHIDDVGNMINQKVSKIREGGFSTTYNHRSANIVASNMFAMLSSSLFEVMDCSDGFIYIDSNNNLVDTLEKDKATGLKTQSPWIFLEMIYASKLRKKMHVRPRIMAEDGMFKSKVGAESRSIEDRVSFHYSADIIDSIEVSSFSDILNMPRNQSHPLLNLDNIYNKLDMRYI